MLTSIVTGWKIYIPKTFLLSSSTISENLSCWLLGLCSLSTRSSLTSSLTCTFTSLCISSTYFWFSGSCLSPNTSHICTQDKQVGYCAVLTPTSLLKRTSPQHDSRFFGCRILIGSSRNWGGPGRGRRAVTEWNILPLEVETHDQDV